MNKIWTAESVLEMSRSFQPACVLAAAADLDLFTIVSEDPQTAASLAGKLGVDPRGLRVLLDALTALQLLEKKDDRYSLPESLEPFLTSQGNRTVLAMAQHSANCMRRWVQLARVVKTGRPAETVASVRGQEADAAAFIMAMDNVSGPVADDVIQAVVPPEFRHLLDIGGASGTWTRAFLRKCPLGLATIFDLPHVIPMAREKMRGEVGLADRVRFASGDFMADSLPAGADLAWVSAIVHQNSRTQNRQLFRKVHQALIRGGRIAVRDIFMDADRTRPVAGALFAVNMLVATEGGGTYTVEELSEDMESSGFVDAFLARKDEQGMHSVLIARKE